MKYVLDSWALLAWLQDERPAANKVEKLLDGAEVGLEDLAMSIINVGEVYYRLAKTRNEAEAQSFLRDFRQMPIRSLAVPKRLVLEAAKLKARYPLSYADAFAVATAIREGAAVVSGDPELRQFISSGVVDIEWIGS